MFLAGKDFDVDTEYGIIRCLPKNTETSSGFKVLQVTVARLIPQMPDAPAVDIDVNGIIGPSVTLAVQVIANQLAKGPHKDLTPLSGLQPEEAVPAIAERSMEIAGYLQSVIEKDPTALINPQLEGEPADPLAMFKNLFTGKRIAAVAGTLVGIAAFVGLGMAVQRRGLGSMDRSSWLPPSDGSDQFDEDEYEGHDDGDDAEPDDGIDRANAIDVESVEVTEQAA